MSAARWLYRTRQFWHALRLNPSPEDLALASAVLTPPQLALFEGLQASDRAHSLRVLCALIAQGEKNKDLNVAALLHDSGKSRFPLRLWERVWIVLGNTFFPGRAKGWGSEKPEETLARAAWRRPFIVAAQHPAWGAELAAGAGASPLATALIRRHQDELPVSGMDHSTLEEELLRKLQAVDNHS